jgi:pimeloyl-ACP methyl ester carboxylesterase
MIYYNILRNLIKINPFLTKGNPTGVYNSSTLIYSSSIDEINNLWLGYSYDNGYKKMPICLILHGWSQTGNQYYGEISERVASYGYFAVSVGMRGRDGASGSRDASCRELYDVYDAYNYIVSTFNEKVNKDSVVLAGWSGGGGNALAMASKFPDLSSVCVSNFGMSDYGYDSNDGWYYTNPSYSLSISDSVGNINDLNTYRARYSVEQINNYLGYIYMFHDVEDSLVSVVHSRNIDNSFNGRCNYFETSVLDNPRWEHSTPDSNESIVKSERFWIQKITQELNKIVPIIGNIQVNGYVVTKRFEIWLGDGVISSNNGTNRSASVSYNTNTGEYDVIPQFESGATQLEVIINQGNFSAQQIITGQTLIIVS